MTVKPTPPAVDAIDEARFFRLLELAGPGTAAELLARLQDDLRGVEQGMALAITDPDWDRIRAHTHVLIALAGAAGASGLQRVAERLNQQAHLRDADGLQTLAQQVMLGTSALIRFVVTQADLQKGAL